MENKRTPLDVREHNKSERSRENNTTTKLGSMYLFGTSGNFLTTNKLAAIGNVQGCARHTGTEG
jgi:hypothetical protein